MHEVQLLRWFERHSDESRNQQDHRQLDWFASQAGLTIEIFDEAFNRLESLNYLQSWSLTVNGRSDFGAAITIAGRDALREYNRECKAERLQPLFALVGKVLLTVLVAAAAMFCVSGLGFKTQRQAKSIMSTANVLSFGPGPDRANHAAADSRPRQPITVSQRIP